MKYYYDQFLAHQEKGLSAYQAGQAKTARFHLLKAAENLLKVADKSTGDVQREHYESAEKLYRLAEGISEKQAAPDRSGDSEKPAGSGEKWIAQERPGVSFDDIAGLRDVKTIIQNRIINPFKYPETTKRYKKRAGGGILLYGPPGTGKTMIAKAIATELDAAFFSVRCSDILSKWVGEAEQNLRSLFDGAKAYDRTIIFVDETEALIPRRGGHSTVMNRIVPEFLSLVDGVDTSEDRAILLLGATNRPWDIDDAALREGRFGEIIHIGAPDFEARRKIIETALSGVPADESVSSEAIAELTAQYTGADIKGLIQKATDYPYEREISSGGASQLTMDDIRAALETRKPSVTRKMLDRYDKFQREHDV